MLDAADILWFKQKFESDIEHGIARTATALRSTARLYIRTWGLSDGDGIYSDTRTEGP